MKRFLLRGIITLLVLAGIGLYFLGGHQEQKAEIQGAAIIEATEVNLSSQIPGRIIDIKFKEGDRVNPNDLVILLDSAEIGAQIKQAEADLANTKAVHLNSETLRKNAELGMRIADADLDKVKVSYEDARKNLARAEGLFSEGLQPQKDYDSILLAFKMAGAQLRVSRAQKDLTRSQYQAALAQIDASSARIRQAEASVELYNARHADTTIRSPISGQVAKRYMEPGEMATPGLPILTIVDLDRVWARVDLEEDKLLHVKLNDKAIIRPAAPNGREYQGRVIEIGPEGEFATQRDVKRGRQDIKTFRVKVELINNDGYIRPGMTAEVFFGEG
jgi:HlyD family secretion protein